jgi:seryl-tRNA(Sec) selenium transferase
MQEEVNEKSIAFGIKASKITAQALMKAMQRFLQSQKSGKGKGKSFEAGKTSMKKLSAQSGGNLSNIEINRDNIGSFDRTARKFGVTYSLKKSGNDKYYVFFKGNSVDAMTAAFKEFTRKQTRKATRPSMLSQLRKMVEQVKNTVQKTKHKSKEQEL